MSLFHSWTAYTWIRNLIKIQSENIYIFLIGKFNSFIFIVLLPLILFIFVYHGVYLCVFLTVLFFSGIYFIEFSSIPAFSSLLVWKL